MQPARTRRLYDGRIQILWARRTNKVTQSMGLKVCEGQDNRETINGSTAKPGQVIQRKRIEGEA